MKITDIRSMRLWGPLHHGQGGETRDKIAVRSSCGSTPTPGYLAWAKSTISWSVRQGIAYMREYFRGRDPFSINAIVSELFYGTSHRIIPRRSVESCLAGSGRSPSSASHRQLCRRTGGLGGERGGNGALRPGGQGPAYPGL